MYNNLVLKEYRQKGNGKCLRKFAALENLRQDYVDGCKGQKKVLSIDA